ncbi:peptidoglycan recognition protein family protein [Aureimonas psammosilenae]|uniref:peptidoglycan recognition protein family protein n=1 Tax=Aureimonas psammosilenae TaxID=2495496 RepID=UPI001260842C|nr:N-acetylmuramoyl-L-alanine amidase [Aureimonas psammosilenae]
MTPDSPLVDEVLPSPNFDERQVSAPDILMLHYTGMEDGQKAAKWLAMPVSKVSCHYLVHEDGRVVQLVREASRAWHAGAGKWQGREDVNSRSIGIEIVNPGHEFGYRAFPEAQIERLIELCRDVLSRWPIEPRNVLAHSDTAPSRKQDPGELFPWHRLHAAGIGHLVPAEPIGGGRFIALGDEGAPVAAFQELLALYGYGIEINGRFDEATRFATLAFQRHFRPERVDGVADVSTVATLHRLLSALPAQTA